jgi:AraC-like DNA-binding protein
LARYSKTANEALVVEISRHKDEATLTIRHVQEPDRPPRQFFELAALWFVRTLHRQTNRHFNPLRITFTHARNADLREVHRFLRCPVDFAQGVDSWVLPQRVMDLPIVSGDRHLLRILTEHADDLLAARQPASGLQSMVANQLVSLLPSGEARAAAVAQRLNMTLRSFTRYLAEEGTTFGEILEQLRLRLAARYLADDRMSLQQIAWQLGYSEPAAFTHAYKRWTGTSPRRARKKPPLWRRDEEGFP